VRVTEEARAQLRFDAGTIVLDDLPGECPLPQFVRDPRVEKYRAPAVARRAAVQYLAHRSVEVEDLSNLAKSLDLKLRTTFQPHPYQKEAFRAWVQSGMCGTVILPTGAGKTFVALGAIASVKRSALVVAPTIALMNQWYSLIVDSFGMEVGILGGGYHEIRDLTVTTYDSAYAYAAEYGNRFDLIIFDEVHHLPSPKYRQIPLMSTAWRRLGLTATYERQDGAHEDLEFLVGPVVYRRGIGDLKGEYLSDFEVVRMRTTLTEDEAQRYESQKARYHAFLKKSGIKPFGAGWDEFIKMSAYDKDARAALIAKQEMKRIVIGCERKLDLLDSLLKQHWQDSVIIFTEQNDLVYRISREFLIPAITHQTKARERKWILDGFKAGEFPAIVSSKVLNEGIDVPSAKIAIILSGSASPREHLQRLGRILRKSGDRKTAILYEVVTSATVEMNVSSRRRKADAYA